MLEWKSRGLLPLDKKWFHPSVHMPAPANIRRGPSTLFRWLRVRRRFPEGVHGSSDAKYGLGWLAGLRTGLRTLLIIATRYCPGTMKRYDDEHYTYRAGAWSGPGTAWFATGERKNALDSVQRMDRGTRHRGVKLGRHSFRSCDPPYIFVLPSFVLAHASPGTAAGNRCTRVWRMIAKPFLNSGGTER